MGMITDCDVSTATHFRGRTPREAEALMRDAQVRRLPVVDRNHPGLISPAHLPRQAKTGSKKAQIAEHRAGRS